MNQRKAKHIRKQSYVLAAEWLRRLLNEDEATKVTVESVRAFEGRQELYILDGTTRRLAPYSSRWFHQRLKRAYKHNTKDLDLTIKSVRELGIHG